MAEKAATDEGSKKPASDVFDLARGADRMRDAAKWLVASFGAVAVVVFAGINLSNIGKLTWAHDGDRLRVAIIGAIAAVVGITGALMQAMGLATASTTTYSDLRSPSESIRRDPTRADLYDAIKVVESDPGLAPWDGDFDALLAELDAAHVDRESWLAAYLDDDVPEPSAAYLNRATLRLSERTLLASQLLAAVSFLRLQFSFRSARFAIATFMLVAAGGAMAFAWASNPPTTKSPTIEAQPIPATLTVDDKLSAKLVAAGCSAPQGTIDVLALTEGPDEKTVIVATMPTPTCAASLRLEVDPQSLRRQLKVTVPNVTR
jgi:hypothetical protein